MDLRSLVGVLPFLSNIYEKNQTKGSRDYDLCYRYAKISQFIIMGVPIAYSLMAMSFQASRFLKYFITSILEPCLGMYFPTLDGYEELSELLTHLFNLFMGPICVLVVTSTDQLIYLIFANLAMTPTVIKMDLLELKTFLEKPSTTREQITSKLVQIIQMHQSYNE